MQWDRGLNEIRISLGNHSEAIKTQVRVDQWFLIVERKQKTVVVETAQCLRLTAQGSGLRVENPRTRWLAGLA